MTVRFSADWAYRGFRALVLENDQLRVVVLPELGAKIWSLIFKPADREMLWHHPRVPPRPAPFGARYDDWFCGGWDEIFPNDAPVAIGGEPYPDHGELWSMPFAWEVATQTSREVTVRLWRPGVVTTTRVEKRLILRAGEPLLRVRHAIHNDGPLPLDFHWKLHPALPLGAGSRIDLPARRVLIDDGFAAGFSSPAFTWPHATGAGGEAVDMRLVPPPGPPTVHFYYAVDLADGWCALTDVRDRIGFGLAFDRQAFGSVWVFGAYGGWRGLSTVILEPCTGYPYELDKAIAQGTHARLAPGDRLETDVSAVVYRGRDHVEKISPDGEVS